MNIQAQVLVNLWVLPHQRDHAKTAAITGGALLPELVIIVFQDWVDSFNSIPLIAAAIMLSWFTRRYFLLAFFDSMPVGLLTLPGLR